MELSRRPGPSVRVKVVERRSGTTRRREDRLTTEEPLEVRVAWPGGAARRVAVTMRTPGHDFELAVGLLHAEGVLSPGDVEEVAYCTDADLTDDQEFNVVTVRLRGAPRRMPAEPLATVTASSSACGVCGAESIADVLDLAAGAPQCPADGGTVSAEVLHGLPDVLRERQRVFDRTGGLHAAGLFSAAGDVWVVREDVGRHNAVDKVVGARVLAGETTAAPVLCVSGRIGFEIIQKAVAAGVGLVAAIGAPTSLAVDLAEQSGTGLVGFLSRDRFVVYAGEARITD